MHRARNVRLDENRRRSYLHDEEIVAGRACGEFFCRDGCGLGHGFTQLDEVEIPSNDICSQTQLPHQGEACRRTLSGWIWR